MVDVSVIIVNYNTKSLTVNCIKSVYASDTGYSFEIILVDNASSDGSVDLIRNLFPKVRVIENKQNTGFARANNQAAEVTFGRYLYILNSDTEIEKDVIEKIVSYGDTSTIYGIIGTKTVYPGGNLDENFYKFPSFLSEFIFFAIGIYKSKDWPLFHIKKYKNYPLTEPVEVDVIAGCSMFVKRDVYKQLGLFNEEFFMYYEDVELCFRLRKSGYKCMYFPAALVKHIHMGSSKKKDGNFKLLVECFRSACIYFKYSKNPLYAQGFKMICYFSWSLEIAASQCLYIFKRDEKIKRKINMLCSLLRGGKIANS